MMSIAQVRSAGSAGNYYTDKDNYYVLGSMGERWAGQGAEQLGLQGSVDKDVFTRLLEGRLPDGADLSRMQDGRNRHRPGYDLTFSAPKSVSMMAMLGGDKRLIEAHNQAVDFAVRQVPSQKQDSQRLLLIIVDLVRVMENEAVWFQQCRPKILFQLSIGQKSRNVLIISVLGYGEHRWGGGMCSVQLRKTNA